MTPGTRVKITPPAEFSQYEGTATVVEPKPMDAHRGCSRHNPSAVRVEYDAQFSANHPTPTSLVYTAWVRVI